MTTINAARLEERVHKLAEFTEAPPHTRRAFTDLYVQARDWLAKEFQQAGLTVSVDAGGNLIGRRPGRQPELPVIAAGSHIDTVAGGGRFDGIVGVLAALEVAQTLQERDERLRHPLEVIDFLSEEPSDYGVSCVGSRALVGALSPDMLEATRPDGERLREGVERMGGRPEALTEPLRSPGDVAAFLELHIEQGRVLEEAGADIGVVTEIVGIHRFEVDIVGRADHAGTTPMALRKDALVGAAHVVQTVDARARAWENPIVATVGQLSVSPGASNVVPEQVRLTLEVRSGSTADMEKFAAHVLTEAKRELQTRGLTLTHRHVTDSSPVTCSPVIQDTLQRAAAQLGYKHLSMPSGAGHDAAYMATVAPTGMIFIPCRDGRSHSPDEWASREQMAAGAETLYRAILELDRRL